MVNIILDNRPSTTGYIQSSLQKDLRGRAVWGRQAVWETRPRHCAANSAGADPSLKWPGNGWTLVRRRATTSVRQELQIIGVYCPAGNICSVEINGGGASNGSNTPHLRRAIFMCRTLQKPLLHNPGCVIPNSRRL